MAKSFTWGTVVQIKKNAPNKLRPGEIGEICSMQEVARYTKSVIYLVEFGDGKTIEVPNDLLEEVYFPNSDNS